MKPNIPPNVPNDIALPLSLLKYLAKEVSPACAIAPWPKKRRVKTIKKSKNIFFINKNIQKQARANPHEITNE